LVIETSQNIQRVHFGKPDQQRRKRGISQNYLIFLVILSLHILWKM